VGGESRAQDIFQKASEYFLIALTYFFAPIEIFDKIFSWIFSAFPMLHGVPIISPYNLAVGVTVVMLYLIGRIFYWWMYQANKRHKSKSKWWEKIAATVKVTVLVLMTVARAFAILESSDRERSPDDYLTLLECADGYEATAPASPRYLRINADDTVALGEAELAVAYDNASAPLVFADDGDFGLVKRGVGVKPVIPTAATDSPTVEPSYLSVRLCIRKGVALPASLSAGFSGRSR
jgi:hypothetical protein